MAFELPLKLNAKFKPMQKHENKKKVLASEFYWLEFGNYIFKLCPMCTVTVFYSIQFRAKKISEPHI